MNAIMGETFSILRQQEFGLWHNYINVGFYFRFIPERPLFHSLTEAFLIDEEGDGNALSAVFLTDPLIGIKQDGEGKVVALQEFFHSGCALTHIDG